MSKGIQMMALNAIKPYPNNPRKNDDAVGKVAESIKEFGFQQPIIVDKDKVIIAGHTRYKAAQSLGLDKVPVIVADELTEEQANAYRLADNKTGEYSVWDAEMLEVELEAIDEIDMSAFGFSSLNGWFEREDRWDDSREEDNDEYNEFLEKFKQKRTTDDCYTPDNIYTAVAEWVEKEYNLKRKNFVRPFYPGGDYQNETYKKTDIVVDNPPFSILTEIVEFYNSKKQPYFLFCPGLSCAGYTRKGCTAICTYQSIEYENGANVASSFLTNLGDGEIVIRTAPELSRRIMECNDENRKARAKEQRKFDYPAEVLTAAKIGYLSKYGEDLIIRKKDCYFIRGLDEQKAKGDAIFGSGFLLSEKAAAEKAAAEKAAAEKAAAEKAAAEKWQLSEREKEIIKSLG